MVDKIANTVPPQSPARVESNLKVSPPKEEAEAVLPDVAATEANFLDPYHVIGFDLTTCFFTFKEDISQLIIESCLSDICVNCQGYPKQMIYDFAKKTENIKNAIWDIESGTLI
jgi:hypothetical protein